jgi:hypothetical protein
VKDRPVTLVITRETDRTSAKEIVIKDDNGRNPGSFAGMVDETDVEVHCLAGTFCCADVDHSCLLVCYLQDNDSDDRICHMPHEGQEQ